MKQILGQVLERIETATEIAGKQWPDTLEGYKQLYEPIKKAHVDIATKVAKEQGWTTSWKYSEFADKSRQFVLRNPKGYPVKAAPGFFSFAEIEISFTEPRQAMKIVREYRSPWPSVDGVKKTSSGKIDIYVTPNLSLFRYRSLKEVQQKFAKELVAFMDYIPYQRYVHSND